MWWSAYGWWWWWFAFVVLFFLLPVGYGWGYRGWGPWYRRRLGPPGTGPAPGEERLAAGGTRRDVQQGWTWGTAAVLWLVLILALVWLVGALVFPVHRVAPVQQASAAVGAKA